MVNYQCYRCGYTNNHKTKMDLHLRRKSACIPKINNVDIEICKISILNGLNYEQYLESQQKNTNKTTSLQQETTKKTIKCGEYECIFCEKILSYKQSYYRHLKTCKEKKKDDEAKKSITELVTILNQQLQEKNCQINDYKDELKKRDNQIDELIKKAGINNSTITQNIQNNIKVLAYKNTDMSKLTDKDILKCLNHSNMCVPYLIKMIHLDPEKPENHNVYISNLKNGYIMVYDGTKWDTKNRDEIIVDMIDDKQGLIEERIEIWIERGEKYPSIMKKFERYLEKKENNKVINKIKEEIRLMLFNNRSLIKTKEIDVI